MAIRTPGDLVQEGDGRFRVHSSLRQAWRIAGKEVDLPDRELPRYHHLTFVI